ncbi:hypothetical protein CORMATOL_01127 [Corynebacterium matruchotii ATCC 33806]|uniref:Uncharacterized protein n=1 Tax=Corynebacterium matruchotii ATCC 33806 TaxID=566549 RepID=C0E2C1_9CORY|nr:hypothetical protein CORMATOL_01127 [Corynebacterium matruchotii ATCC 33806]
MVYLYLPIAMSLSTTPKSTCYRGTLPTRCAGLSRRKAKKCPHVVHGGGDVGA